MSTTIDDITCPNCKGDARRDQDNKSSDIYIYCPKCKYSSENGDVTNEGEDTFKCRDCGEIHVESFAATNDISLCRWCSRPARAWRCLCWRIPGNSITNRGLGRSCLGCHTDWCIRRYPIRGAANCSDS